MTQYARVARAPNHRRPIMARTRRPEGAAGAGDSEPRDTIAGGIERRCAMACQRSRRLALCGPPRLARPPLGAYIVKARFGCVPAGSSFWLSRDLRRSPAA